jgi:glutamyl-tRNA synthetase
VQELPDYLEANWQTVAALLKTRVQRFSDVQAEIDFLVDMPAFDAELYNNKRNKVNPEKAAELMPKLVALLENVSESDWNNDSLYAKLEEYIAANELKKGLVMWVLRIGVAGKSVTPGGATEILSVLGKENSLARLQKSLANLTA